MEQRTLDTVDPIRPDYESKEALIDTEESIVSKLEIHETFEIQSNAHLNLATSTIRISNDGNQASYLALLNINTCRVKQQIL